MKCDAFKNTQLIIRPTSKTSDYSAYSEKFRNNIFEFLYGNKSSKEVLKNIDNLTKIHTISFSTEDGPIGIIIGIIIIISVIFMVFSSLFLFNKKFKDQYLNFLSVDFWFLFIIGSIIITITNFTDFNEIKISKCHFKFILFSLGNTFIITPLLYKLIIDFPEENKFSKWISYHRYLFLFIFIIIDIIFYILYFLAPYKIAKSTTIDGKIYQTCKIYYNFTAFIVFIRIFFGIILLIILTFLVFIEWNLKETHYELKLLISAIFIDIICIIILSVLKLSNMQHNNYLSYYIIYFIIDYIFSLSNFIFIYAIKIIGLLIKLKLNYDNKRENNDLQGTFKSTIDYNYSLDKDSIEISQSMQVAPMEIEFARKNSNSSNFSSSNKIYQKILNYHNKNSIEDINYNYNLSKNNNI